MDAQPVLDLVAAATPVGFALVGIGATRRKKYRRRCEAGLVDRRVLGRRGLRARAACGGGRAALAGTSGRCLVLDWVARRPGGIHRVEPSGIVVVEGVCALHRMFREEYDVRVWVEAPYETRLARGVARDGEAARATWVEQWMPAEDRYVERDDPIACADLVVDGAIVRPGVTMGARLSQEVLRCASARRPSSQAPRCSSPSAARPSPSPRPSCGRSRCQPGAVRGYIAVSGDPAKGIANIGDVFTSAGSVIGARFNCAGAAPQAAASTSASTRCGSRERRPIVVASSAGAETTVAALGERHLPDRPLGARAAGRDRHAVQRGSCSEPQPLQTRAFG